MYIARFLHDSCSFERDFFPNTHFEPLQTISRGQELTGQMLNGCMKTC